MKNTKFIQSMNPDIDTFKCPKCKAIWRAEGHYDYDEGGWAYDNDEEYCPNGCYTLFGFKLKGKVVK